MEWEIIDAENGLDIDGFKAAAENVYDYFAEDWGDMPDLIRAVQPEKWIPHFSGSGE